MSLLFVSYDNSKPDGNKLTQVEIDSGAVKIVYDEVIVPIAQYVDDAEFLDEAEADVLIDNVNFAVLDADAFNRAYELLGDACEKHNRLKPYKDELNKAFKADPRYQAPNLA